MKWLELFGEAVVLVAAGFQIFVVLPLTGEAVQANFNLLNLKLALLVAPEGSDWSKSQEFLSRVDAGANVDHLIAMQSDLSLYAGIAFLIGGILVIYGKSHQQ